jgi:nitrogen fixation NifU-like protein
MDSHQFHIDDFHGGKPESPFWRHARHPQNVGKITQADGEAQGVGSCGDTLEVFLRIYDEYIDDIRHMPHGCVYTVACGSAMSILAKGRSIENALSIEPTDIEKELGGLPEDHLHCARLAVNSLGEAVADYYRRRYGKENPKPAATMTAVPRKTVPTTSEC